MTEEEDVSGKEEKLLRGSSFTAIISGAAPTHSPRGSLEMCGFLIYSFYVWFNFLIVSIYRLQKGSYLV